jgi:hypothetical protein
MKRYNPYYYLLFVLLVFGAFASMAQNGYGIRILGGVALAFSVIFLIQLIDAIRKKKFDAKNVVELGSLVLLSGILFMRVFYIRFPMVEVVFAFAGAGLIGSYLLKLITIWNTLKAKDKALGVLVVLFLASIIFYTISMTIVPFAPVLAEPSGALAFGLLLAFVVIGFVKREFLLDGEKLSAFSFVLRLKDRSIVLATLFLMFTAYLGLTRIGVLPKMYLDEFPQAYYQLVNQAESGTAGRKNGKFRHEEFKEKYDRFVRRQVGK